ncbi:transcription elongation factor NusA [Aerococcus urinaehominis]|uniref:Transcription termination/antitermination protein NusA n=1 Tax=Aerococcus urinaehominis TaxID=128944 RepID=A0A0X8FK70_9LACT|nr:transcription termination factor NusA [Aerococcus urinaehominis]AMB98822.1 transcription elongation factor NusA [Aerococcus urinaehominis]SDM48885.1 NusA antitermination factor [Aerococcus urinaehominis]
MSKEILKAFDMLEEEKGISRDIIIEALESALVSAYRRNYNQAQNVEVKFDQETGDLKVFSVKEVVEVVLDSTIEVSLADAHDIHPAYELGDMIKFEVTPKDFGRIAAQTAKQVITQRLREAERGIIYEEFIDYEDDLLTGIVERQDRRYVYVNLGKIEAVLTPEGQIPNEIFQPHERVQVYVERVENTTKGPQIYVSRSHPNLLKRLFEQEVPEIYDGTVEIKSIAREAGDRSKIAVVSHDDNVDPVGTCVGPRGSRVQTIVNELKGENMDIIEWSADEAEYISSALNPADVQSVHFVPGENAVVVVVPDNHLSLAIGKRGQNARLAAKLTGYKIDIKSESDFAEYVDSPEYAERFAEKEDESIDEFGDEADFTDLDQEVNDLDQTALDAAEVAEYENLDSYSDLDASLDEVAGLNGEQDIKLQDNLDEGNVGAQDVEDLIGERELDLETDYEELQIDEELAQYEDDQEEISLDD